MFKITLLLILNILLNKLSNLKFILLLLVFLMLLNLMFVRNYLRLKDLTISVLLRLEILRNICSKTSVLHSSLTLMTLRFQSKTITLDQLKSMEQMIQQRSLSITLIALIPLLLQKVKHHSHLNFRSDKMELSKHMVGWFS